MAKPKEERKKLSGVRFVSPPFRLSFPHIFKPHSWDGKAEPKYSIVMLVPKAGKASFQLGEKKVTARQFMDAQLRKAAREAWGKEKEKWPKIFWPWRDGDESADKPGYEGHDHVQADSKSPPEILDRNREALMSEREIYPGCYCKALLTAVAVPGVGKDDSGKPKNFVKFYLNAVQFWEDGEKLGGGGDAKKAFAEADDGEEDEGGDDDYEIDLD